MTTEIMSIYKTMSLGNKETASIGVSTNEIEVCV